MNYTGKLIEKCQAQTGEGQRGPWIKQVFITEELEGKYPKKVAFTAFNDEVEALNKIAIGSTIAFRVELTSNQSGDRWFTNVNAKDIVKI